MGTSAAALWIFGLTQPWVRPLTSTLVQIYGLLSPSSLKWVGRPIPRPQMLRVLRVVRIFRLVKAAMGMRKLLRTLYW